MNPRIILVIALSIPLLGFLGRDHARKGKAPVILDSYAASEVQPGVTWRVFLHAKDADGDMKDITAMLLEPGNVISPVSFTRIKDAADRREFRGYLYLKTPREAFMLGKQLFISVQVRDLELNRSEAVRLPLNFANVAKDNVPDNWQDAANHGLGGIRIELGQLNDWRSVY
jgi:hypothetical protein